MQKPAILDEQNSGAPAWSENERRAKDVAIRYHFVRDLVRDQIIRVMYCPTRYISGDILTKEMPS